MKRMNLLIEGSEEKGFEFPAGMILNVVNIMKNKEIVYTQIKIDVLIRKPSKAFHPCIYLYNFLLCFTIPNFSFLVNK